MQSPRYPFTITRLATTALISMDCDGAIRCREMPFHVLDALLRACQEIRTELAPRLLRDNGFCEAVPPYPALTDCLRFYALAGVCDVQVVASRDGTEIEFCSAFYDADDSSAPALVLVADQLDDFVREANRVLIAAAAERPPTA